MKDTNKCSTIFNNHQYIITNSINNKPNPTSTIILNSNNNIFKPKLAFQEKINLTSKCNPDQCSLCKQQINQLIKSNLILDTHNHLVWVLLVSKQNYLMINKTIKAFILEGMPGLWINLIIKEEEELLDFKQSMTLHQ